MIDDAVFKHYKENIWKGKVNQFTNYNETKS